MAKKHNAPAKPALEPNEALFQAVSLCRKAGALTMGFDAVEDAVVKGKAWLVMTASDAVMTSHALPLTTASSTASKPMVSAPALRQRLTA